MEKMRNETNFTWDYKRVIFENVIGSPSHKKRVYITTVNVFASALALKPTQFVFP